jgi:hypothetical protein
MRWRKEKNPTTWVGWMWHDHPWFMRKARIRYEASVLYWRIFHPIETYRRRREAP